LSSFPIFTHQFTMDLLALPDVFLRKLMRTMTMKDRMAARLTCRAFERLVANSHAGCFENARIIPDFDRNNRKRKLITIDDHSFGDIDSEEGRSEQILQVAPLLFSRISIQSAVIECDGDVFCLDFVRSFTKKFIIQELILVSRTKKGFENSLLLMNDFPKSKCTFDLLFLPEDEALLALPPISTISIWARSEMRLDEPWQLYTSLFFKLIETHRNIYVKHVPITSDELEKTIEIIDKSARKRSVHFLASSFTIIRWLRKYGMSEESQ
ncbi:hypothetical protein PMAYCL1PPCAC_19702, partial [Pristionchus mayeri]